MSKAKPQNTTRPSTPSHVHHYEATLTKDEEALLADATLDFVHSGEAEKESLCREKKYATSSYTLKARKHARFAIRLVPDADHPFYERDRAWKILAAVYDIWYDNRKTDLVVAKVLYGCGDDDLVVTMDPDRALESGYSSYMRYEVVHHSANCYYGSISPIRSAEIIPSRPVILEVVIASICSVLWGEVDEFGHLVHEEKDMDLDRDIEAFSGLSLEDGLYPTDNEDDGANTTPESWIDGDDPDDGYEIPFNEKCWLNIARITIDTPAGAIKATIDQAYTVPLDIAGAFTIEEPPFVYGKCSAKALGQGCGLRRCCGVGGESECRIKCKSIEEARKMGVVMSFVESSDKIFISDGLVFGRLGAEGKMSDYIIVRSLQDMKYWALKSPMFYDVESTDHEADVADAEATSGDGLATPEELAAWQSVPSGLKNASGQASEVYKVVSWTDGWDGFVPTVHENVKLVLYSAAETT